MLRAYRVSRVAGAVLVGSAAQGLVAYAQVTQPQPADQVIPGVGLISAGDFVSTGIQVSAHTVVTVAHGVVHPDSAQLRNDTRWHDAWHQPIEGQIPRSGLRPVGIIRWAGYADALAYEQTQGGATDFATLNVDLAVLYFLNPLPSDAVPVHLLREGDPYALHTLLHKRFAGYAVESEKVDFAEQGLLHANAPQPLLFNPTPLDVLSPGRSYGVGDGLVHTAQADVWEGMSGGPLLVTDADGRAWARGAVTGVLYHAGETYAFVRAFDEAAWDLVEEAAASAGETLPGRVKSLSLSKRLPRSITLSWQIEGAADEIAIYRETPWGLTLVRQVAANATAVTLAGLDSGSEYRFAFSPVTYQAGVRVQTPPRETQTFTTAGSHELGSRLGLGNLFWIAAGKHHPVWDGSLGAVQLTGEGPFALSDFMLTVMGPGSLSFDWRVSSEAGYDLLEVWMGSYRVAEISGETGWSRRAMELPEGKHTVRWRYAKDISGSAGNDSGYLRQVAYESRAPGQALPGEIEDGDGWRASAWLGRYWPADLDLYHEELAWLKAYPSGKGSWFWPYNRQLGWFYSSAELYPIVWSYDREDYLYYYQGSGAWFHDYALGQDVRLD